MSVTTRSVPVARRRRSVGRVLLSLIVVVGAACGGSPDDTSPTAGADEQPDGSPTSVDLTAPAEVEVPPDLVATTPMDGPTVIDVPSRVVISETVGPDGAELSASGMTLRIPAGAAADTTVEVVELDAPFHANPYAPDEPDAIPVALAGPTFDVGPAGVQFAEPVEVVLPYDPTPVRDDLGALAVAYWTGASWGLLPAAIDTEANTVTVRMESFDGTVLAPSWASRDDIKKLFGTTNPVGTTVARRVLKWVDMTDPIIDGTASEYVTPDAPEIEAAAQGTTIDGVPLTDELELAKHLAELKGGSGKIMLPGPDGSPRPFTYSAGNGSNWQKPVDHISPKPSGNNFDGVPAMGDMQGDCTDVTNTMTSIFIALGYPAKSVFGYTVDTDSAHAWTEVVIGGEPYIVHENGDIQALEDAVKRAQLIRPGALDNRSYEWDDQGQREYVEEWWNASRIDGLDGSWTGTITWERFTPPAWNDEQARCTSNDGLPLRVELRMQLQSLGDDRYYMAYSRGGVSCWAYEPDDPLGESYWQSPGPIGADGEPIDDAGDYGLELRRAGQVLFGTDPLGVTFTGMLSIHSSGETIVSGTIVRNDTQGGVLEGTWVARRRADLD